MDDVVRAIVKILKSKTINLAELMDISVKTVGYTEDDWKELIERVILELYPEDNQREIKETFRDLT